MESKNKIANFDLSVESKIHCLAVQCVNNISHVCNLKGMGVDENAQCAGLVELKKPKAKKADKLSNEE